MPAAAVIPSSAALSRRLEVRIETSDTFAQMHRAWTTLVRASLAPSPFLTWEWMYAWWTNLAEGDTLALLTVRNDEDVIGLAPLRVTRPRTWPWLARLEFLGSGLAGSDYLDIVARRDRTHEVADALADALHTWGLPLHLRHLPALSMTSEVARRLVARGWSWRGGPDGVCPHVALTGTWDCWLSTRGAAHRANVRRRLRALARRDARMTRVTTEPERRAALDALARFHAQRFGPGGSTALGTPALLAFHDAATRRMMTEGTLWLHTLTLDGRLAAVMYGFEMDGRVYFYQHGFDAEHQRDSLGLVLMALSIRAAIEGGAHDFDMLYGVESYKRLWASDQRRLSRLDLFPPRLRGAIQHAATGAAAAVRRSAGRLRRGFGA